MTNTKKRKIKEKMKQKKCVDTLKVYNYIFLDFTQLFLLCKVNSFLIYHIHLSNLTCSYKCQSAVGIVLY